MKKKSYWEAFACPNKNKLLLTMKISFLLVTITVLNVQASLYSQNAKLDFTVKDKTVREIFKVIEKQSNFRFFYNDEFTDLNNTLSLSVKDQKLDEVMKSVLSNSNVTYKVIDNNIVVITPAQAKQQKQVSGVVRDRNGAPLPGVNVTVKGTTRGVVTDVDGKYILDITSPDEILVFSFVGYLSEEIAAGSQAKIDIALIEDIKNLDEIVVIGYGINSKRNVTGAIASVKSSELGKSIGSTFDVALQGQASGVQVSQAGGKPGAGVRIQVRGTNSLSAGTEPLYIVDGFPINQDLNSLGGDLNPLASINVKDIESIDVLKDAASTAIYGSRGSNGVVMITTKSGKKGQGVTTVDYSYSISRPTHMVGLVNATTWLNLVDQGWKNDGKITTWDPEADGNLSSQYIKGTGELSRAVADKVANSGGTDWLSPITRDAVGQEINFSTSNGFDKGKYFISAIYRKDQGYLVGNDLDHYGIRANLDFTPIKRLALGLHSNFTYFKQIETTQLGQGSQSNFNGGRNDQGGSGGFGSATGNSLPIFPIYSVKDSTKYWDPYGGMNTLVASLRSNREIINLDFRTINSGYVDFELIDNLHLRSEVSIDYASHSQNTYIGEDIRYYSRYGQNATRQLFNLNANLFATYSKKFGDHYISGTAGLERQQRTLNQNLMVAENLTSNDHNLGEPAILVPLTPIYYTLANGTVQSVVDKTSSIITFLSGTYPDYRIASYFGRLNYNFKNKYLVGFSLRRDGASVFASNKQFGTFPSASIGWIASEESFMKSVSVMNFLKLRASYGKVGNSNIPNVLHDYYASWPYYAAGGSAYKLDNYGASVNWENTTSYDAGFDYGFFENRISGSVSYYTQQVDNMLLSINLAPSIGVNSVWKNIGSLKNSGLEFSVSSMNFVNRDFKWSTSVNLSLNQNKVGSLSPDIDKLGTGITNGSFRTRTGERIGTFYLPEYAGLNKDGDPTLYVRDPIAYLADGSTVRLASKLGGDSVSIANSSIIDNNRFFMKGKTGLPTYYGGFSNTFSYKGLELSVLFTFQGGNYIFDDQGRAQTTAVGANHVIRQDLVDNYWTPENTGAEFPRLSIKGTSQDGKVSINTQSDKYLQKGDYIRLKNIQLAYNLPSSIIGKTGLKGVRVYVSLSNLLTFTKYKGYDPELVNLDGTAQNRNLQQGMLSDTRYPQMKSISGGLSISF